jgi:hypothetical protein
MNARDLSKVLRPYGASPQDIWIGRRTVKGYCADELQDAWDRYLPQS